MKDRAEWLKQMRDKAEALYDLLSPLYWVKFGLRVSEMHRENLQKFLERLPPRSPLLSAACGAGAHDGILLEAGHRVLGIDQSQKMLTRAREHFPGIRYEKIGLQEIDFREAFDGVTCIDAMEHVCPEDWPGVLQRFREALKPDGVLYFTVDLGGDHVKGAYERAKAMGLSVVFGEVADKVEQAFERAKELDMSMTSEELGDSTDSAVYHYHPSLDQVQIWLRQAGLAIEDESTGNWYEHFLIRKK